MNIILMVIILMAILSRRNNMYFDGYLLKNILFSVVITVRNFRKFQYIHGLIKIH
eukprot:UN12126